MDQHLRPIALLVTLALAAAPIACADGSDPNGRAGDCSSCGADDAAMDATSVEASTDGSMDGTSDDAHDAKTSEVASETSGDGGADASSGDAHDPSTTTPYGTWHAIAKPPFGFVHPMQVWTGTEALFCDQSSGAAYDPVADRWRDLSIPLAPRSAISTAWTGSKIFVYVMSSLPAFTETYLFDPATKKFADTSLTGRPELRSHPLVVWAGDRIIVMGGSSEGPFDGAQYDPTADLWTPLPTTGAPTTGVPTTTNGAIALWTGSEVLVWGGCSAMASSCVNGWLYSPSKGTWRAMSTVGAMLPTSGFAHAWTGSTLFVWGGELATLGGLVDGSGGGAYSLATDSWTTLPSTSILSPRTDAFGAWTANEFVVWSGWSSTIEADRLDGARWDPALGVWKTMSIDHAPACDSGGSVWTGDELVVVCGQSGGTAIPAAAAMAWKP